MTDRMSAGWWRLHAVTNTGVQPYGAPIFGPFPKMITVPPAVSPIPGREDRFPRAFLLAGSPTFTDDRGATS